MSNTTKTRDFYHKVIEEVIQAAKEKFINEGLSEDILDHLKAVLHFLFAFKSFRCGNKNSKIQES
jgi:hypothetical protein